jgi:type III secretion system YscD/HrpQ family protein
MNDVTALELRVLCGPQAGCSLPLITGIYRAGSDECCDVVLDGLAPGESAFVLYVGHKAVALESLMEGVRVEGRPARGLRELEPGQPFELGQWLFVVDPPDSPWPEDPESLRPGEQPEQAPAGGSGSSDEPESEEASMEDSAAVAAPAGSDDAPAAQAGEESAQETAVRGPGSPTRRRRLPFWLLGLGSTAAFLCLGMLALALSLAPAKRAPAADPRRGSPALDQIVAAAGDGSEVKLDHLPSGRLRLAGRVGTRLQRTNLIREARKVDPSILVEVGADEDLQALARDVLTRFPGADVELAVKLGHVTLKGHVPTGKLREAIMAALRDGVPGMAAVDDEIKANDDALAALHELLAGAGLAEKVDGHMDGDDARLVVEGTLDEAGRNAWLEVRRELATRFGPSLAIVEELHAPATAAEAPHLAAHGGAAPHGDVVAVVGGTMPYVMLAGGEKLGTSAVLARAR